MDDIDLGLENSPKKAKGGLNFIVFLIGIAIGVAGALLLPRYLSTFLPPGLGGGGESVEGPVLGKRAEEGRLLLTVNAQQGAVLATFSERVAEIDLLVDVGDTITLGVSGYEPFIDDPAFRGVRKAAQAPAAGRLPFTDSGAMIEEEPEGAVPAAADSQAVIEASGAEAQPLRLPRVEQQDAAGDTIQR